MAKRNSRSVNASRGLPASKPNTNLSSRSPPAAADPLCPQTLDYLSYVEPAWNIDGESETTLPDVEVRGTRVPSRSRGGKRSGVVTLAALVSVHAVLLVTYGVHSKWPWATELTDSLAAVTYVFIYLFLFLPSPLRPRLVGPMRNPTSPHGLESLRGFCNPQNREISHITKNRSSAARTA